MVGKSLKDLEVVKSYGVVISRVFREEGEALRRLALSLDGELKASGGCMLVFPGHGDYYRAELLAGHA